MATWLWELGSGGIAFGLSASLEPSYRLLKFFPSGPIRNEPILVQIMACHRTGEKPLQNQWWFRLLIHLHFMRHAASMINTLFKSISVFVIIENNLLRPVARFHISDRPSSKSITTKICDYLWLGNCKAFDIGRIANVYSIVYLIPVYWNQAFADRLWRVMYCPL